MTNWKDRLLPRLPERLQVTAWALRKYRRKFGKLPNLFHPATFNEAMQARKILNRDKRLPLLADKLLVKDYVSGKLSQDWVIPTLWFGKELPPLSQRNWPKPFVVKINSGSGWNVFVRTEEECDWEKIEARCRSWMASKYGISLGEWHYSKIDPMIMIEPFINFGSDLPVDYKFWMFKGKIEFIHVVTNRERGRIDHFYDADWQSLPYSQGYPVGGDVVPQPRSFAEMKRGAEVLAAGFDFIRVDFYEVAERPLFGELTFFPDAGYGELKPIDVSARLAALLR